MTETLLRIIVAHYALPWDGTHGIRHWGRVLENGMKLAEQTGVDLQTVEPFALFHHYRRRNEGRDPGHGQRGGDLAQTLHLTGALKLSEDRSRSDRQPAIVKTWLSWMNSDSDSTRRE